ncbi:MAG: tetratricopeptide repeat protein [Devosia sp.]|nr:tetratricopeptide repeat protein [Devosia sp.]
MTDFRKSRPRAPSKPAIDALLQQGLALHQSGRGPDAAVFYERVLERDSRQPAANHLLGLVRLQQGRPDEAVDRISRAVAAAPNNAQYLSNLGVALNAAGRSREAVEVLERAIIADVTSAETSSNLGMAFRALGRFEDAVAVYRRAVRLKPNEPGFHYNLANALRDAGYLFDAESAYRRAVQLRPGYTGAINGLAAMLDGQGRSSEAIDLIDAALARQPNDPDLNLRRSRALYHQNRIEDAVEAFDRTLALSPGFGEAHLQRAYIVRHESRDSAVAAMEQLFRAETAPLDDRIFAGFGLGKALADLGEHHASIAAFSEANRLHRARTPFALDKALARMQDDLRRFDGIDGPHANGGFREASPIFVVGLPRSGKTTVETMLARHPSVAGAGELPTMGRLVKELLAQQQGVPLAEIPPDRFTELGRAYMREAQSLVPPGKVVVDTMPGNFQHVGFIRLALPYARIIRAVRTPADHCVAIFEKYLTGGGYEYANDLDELQPFHSAFRDMMAGWRARFPGAVHDIALGDVAENRQGEIRRLLEFCGLVWNDAVMAEARSEPQYRDWPRERIVRNRMDHLAAWREIRPSLFD